MNNVCFVIMPYGPKEDIDKKIVDFDVIYESMIKAAVKSVGTLECQRCDDIEQPGWIHERMLRHIFEDRVAIVDTSTLNANVFYELGVRHALRKAVTVLIHGKGTTWPFNIAGLSSIEYANTPEGFEEGKDRIRAFIVNALNDPGATDSLVYSAIPDLQVQRLPRRITKLDVIPYVLAANPEKRIGFVTGDREDIRVGDVWVSSENTNMQMDTFYGRSTSATIRYLGARKDETGRIEEDTIGLELAGKLKGRTEVDPGTVLATGAGALTHNGVKRIFHVAAVRGQPREGYQPVPRLDQCVKNALRRAGDDEFRNDGLTSMLFPIFGTGPGGGNLQRHAEICLDAAVEHLSAIPSPIRDVFFYVFGDVDLEICTTIARNHRGLKSA